MPKLSRYASERPYWYTVIILDPHGRSIGSEELIKPTTRAAAYKRLLQLLSSELLKSDTIVYGGHLLRDERNRQ